MESLLSKLTPQEGLPHKDIHFRNYVPKDKQLRKNVVSVNATVGETEMELEKELKLCVKEFLNQLDKPIEVVPQKANWDLKRDLDKKLKPLKRQTEEAILELVHKKLKTQENS